MNTTNPSKIEAIIARIRKLLALSKSPNEHEAAAAVAAAAKLQAEYQIEQATLEDAGEPFTAEDIDDLGISQSEKGTWKNAVAGAVATLNGCHIYTSGSDLHFHGRRTAVQTASYTTQFLWTAIQEITRREWDKKAGRVAESAVVWQRSFIFGCANRVGERLRAMHAENMKIKNAGIAGGDRALMVVAKHDLEVASAWANLSRNFRQGRAQPTGRMDKTAYNAGRSAGNGVGLGGERLALGASPGRIAA
jgi:hypothetical protein